MNITCLYNVGQLTKALKSLRGFIDSMVSLIHGEVPS